MAGQAAAVMREADEGDDLSSPVQPRSEPALRPVESGHIRQESPAGGESPINFVEVDDEGQPLPEANLSEHESVTDRPLIESEEQAGEAAQVRRLSRAQRRARQKHGRDNTLAENAILKRQIGELKTQLEGINGEFSSIRPQLTELQRGRLQGEINRFDGQIAEQGRTIEQSRIKIRDAMQSNDSDALLAAMEARDNAVIAKTRLETEKKVYAAALTRVPNARGAGDEGSRQTAEDQDGEARGNRAPAPEISLPPNVMARVREFQEAYPWFDLSGADIDSKEVLKLDAIVNSAGYERDSDAYWDVLEDMMEKRLPHRFAQAVERGAAPASRTPAPRAPAQPAVNVRRAPPVAGAGERNGAPANGSTVKLTPQRKNALIEIGVLDPSGKIVDRSKFDRYLRQYQSFDRANGLA